MKDKKKLIDSLVSELNEHSKQYYVHDNPSISDKEYDEKYDLLQSLEKETGYVLPYSPTMRIGDELLDEFTKHTHLAPLWSLDKAQSLEEVLSWHERNQNFIDNHNEGKEKEDKLPPLKYIVTRKFDGLTVNLTYNSNGVLETAATRGTGRIGENVTNQVKTISSVPLRVDNEDIFEIHGEAMMPKDAFVEYNKEAKTLLKNTRNAAAGALRNLDIRETKKRNLTAYFYDIGYKEGDQFQNYREMISFIDEMGFLTDGFFKEADSFVEVEKIIKEIEKERENLNFDIDGVVVAIDDIETRNLLGFTVKFPRWAIAYKFEAEETTTKVLDVEWNVGRSGRVNPTAILEPVELVGATIQRATLNNMDDIRRKNVKIGSSVLLRRSNDVIPEILKAVEGESNEEETEIIPPEYCPSCGTKLIEVGAHIFCENTLSCKPQLLKNIVHFASRDAMNIEGLSEKTADQLFDKLNIKNVSDIYSLKEEDLLTLDLFKEKRANNLLDEIEKSKDVTLHAFIYALGIPNVGISTSRDLENEFKTLENIRNASKEELINVPDIGEIVALNILEFFSSDNIKTEIENLLSKGINIKEIERNEKKELSSVFTGKTVVLTGAMENFTRKEAKERLLNLGAKVTGSVSKNTDFVVYGKDPGSKYDKAISLNIDTLTEEEFIEKLED